MHLLVQFVSEKNKLLHHTAARCHVTSHAEPVECLIP